MKLSRERFVGAQLQEDISAEITVVGGGISGLATAIELRRRGHDVVLIEAAGVGYGASGRANGQVISALTRHGPDAILKLWPGERGERLVQLVLGASDRLYDLIDRYVIDCDARRSGWLQPAHTPGRAVRAAGLAAQWRDVGAPTMSLTREEIARRLGTDGYAGGWGHRRGGHINPYAFTVGLARAAVSEGVRVYEGTPAINLRRRAETWTIETPKGAIASSKIVIATAAYTGNLWPKLRRSIVPVTSYQASTRPLGSQGESILPNDEASSDTRMDLRYFRKDREGRLVSGGALAVQLAAERRLPKLVAKRLREMFPTLPSDLMEFFWGGRIAMTTDRLPHLHRTQDGLVAWLGCNGRGLALACAMAPVVADAVEGRADQELSVWPTRPTTVPFYGLVARFARLILVWYRFKDRREI
jgi:glycine/D-amino acid oxidase-like deaminating enzyme